MSNRLQEKDGLSRQEYENRGEKGQKLEVLESDASVLLAQVLNVSRKVVFFDDGNREAGTWQEVWWWEPLVVLTEIKMLDTGKIEREFAVAGTEGIKKGCELLSGKIKNWCGRLGWGIAEELAADLREIDTEQQQGKALFYTLLEGIRRLQVNDKAYLDAIEIKGQMDPALALLLVFVRNFGKIAARFNDRWSGLADLYLEKVLHVRPRGVVPDRVWLSLNRVAGKEDVMVKKGTAFMAAGQLCYRSAEDCCVGEMRPGRIISLLLESDPEWQPAADMGFTTGIWKKELSCGGSESGEQLFGGKDACFASVGLVVESPMLLLKDGIRDISLAFYLTEESGVYFGQVERMCGGNRLLNDAFYLEISTENGWMRIVNVLLSCRERQSLEFAFRLNEDFPSVVPCSRDIHSMETGMPALRILLNREAWLFPYSWARQVAFDKMKINVRVTGSRTVKVYNELGEIDVNMPFYPLGVQPERGAWMVFGNYEMALKPLVSTCLSCRWIGLPRNPGGLQEYYASYGENTGNENFRVRTEWMADGKWCRVKEEDCALFTTGEEARINEVSRICCRPDQKMPVITCGEQAYGLGRVRGGFIRMVFTSPEMGFGHKLFRQLFARVMMHNSRRKKQLPVPAEPVSPQIDALTLDYEAADEVLFVAGGKAGLTRLYHMSLLGHQYLLPVQVSKPVNFIAGTDSLYNLIIEFEKVTGYNRLRFFVDFAPLLMECVAEELPDREGGNDTVHYGSWSIFRRSQWQVLPAMAVLRDDTEGFMKSGLIEIELPNVIKEDDLNSENRFLLKVEFREKMKGFPMIRGIHPNVVEVIGEDGEKGIKMAWGAVWKLQRELPGITSVVQASEGCGGQSSENRERMAFRLANRIAGRGRLVTATDYERAVLQHFPQVDKVKCLPALDAKRLGRKGLVTLVMMQRQEDGSLPLCSNSLLLEAEELLSRLTASFVTVDAVNPVYEEMTVRCRIRLMPGNAGGVVMKKLQDKLNGCIAPWLTAGKMPEFGYFFSLQVLRNVILGDAGVAGLSGLSVLHVTALGEREYKLNEYVPEPGEKVIVKASAPWCIAIPSASHLIELEQDWTGQVGIGELKIGKTMIVGPAAGEEEKGSFDK